MNGNDRYYERTQILSRLAECLQEQVEGLQEQLAQFAPPAKVAG